jgi:hypothetical protein
MIVLLTLHSLIRWAIIFVALATLIKFALGLVQKHPYDRMAGGLSAAFSGLMDTQALLGGLFFVLQGAAMPGGFALRYRWEHLAIMLIAVVVGHLPALWKKLDDRQRYRNGLLAILVALLLVVVGVSALPGNRWLVVSGLF